MGACSGFGEGCWFGDDKVFSLDGVDGGRTGVVDVVCTFSSLTGELDLVGKGDTVQHLFDRRLRNGISTKSLSPQSEI
jgi:hypothetical protein